METYRTHFTPIMPVALAFPHPQREREALALAGDIVAADRICYEALWREKRSAPGAADALAELGVAWAEVMGAAVDEPRRQPDWFGSVEELFNAADRLNELFLVKMRTVCDAHGGAFHRAARTVRARIGSGSARVRCDQQRNRRRCGGNSRLPQRPLVPCWGRPAATPRLLLIVHTARAWPRQRRGEWLSPRWRSELRPPGELMGGMLLLWLSGEMVSQKSVLRR